MPEKQRPLVDQKSYDLASAFLADYQLVPHDSADQRADAEWDLASYIQQAIEDWLGDAEQHHRIEELQ